MYPTRSILPCFQFLHFIQSVFCHIFNKPMSIFDIYIALLWPDSVKLQKGIKSAHLTVFECLKPLSFRGLRALDRHLGNLKAN